MQNWSRYLLLLALLAIVGIAGYRYEQYVLARNFLMEVQVPCDPASEACFALACDSEDEECDTTPYKKVEVLASEAPACAEEHTCEAFTCSGDSCSETYCAEDTLEEGEQCVIPVEPEPQTP